MLAPDVEQERALLGAQLAPTPTVGARARFEGLEATPAVCLVPALERRRAIALRGTAAGRPIAALRQFANFDRQIAARQLATNQRADDFGTKQSHRLGVVTRAEQVFGHKISFGLGG